MIRCALNSFLAILMLATPSFARECLIAATVDPAGISVAHLEAGDVTPLFVTPTAAPPSRPTALDACGRFVYQATTAGEIQAFEVGDGGSLRSLPGYVAPEPGGYFDLRCDPARAILYATRGPQSPFQVMQDFTLETFRIDGLGGLVRVERLTLVQSRGISSGGVDINPLNGDFVGTWSLTPNGDGFVFNNFMMFRLAVDADAELIAIDEVVVRANSRGRAEQMAFTRDGQHLLQGGFRSGLHVVSSVAHCFIDFRAPFDGVPFGEAFTCSGPLAGVGPPSGLVPTTSFESLAVPPAGGPIFYAQVDGALHTARIDPTQVTSIASVEAAHASRSMLLSSDGSTLISLGDGSVSSYAIAAGGIDLGLIESEPMLMGNPVSAVLLPCDGELDADFDTIPDASDNCTDVANPEQTDIDAGADDDSSLAGVQHYGDACDADLDDDGFVGASDFFDVLRPCFGADVAATPACAKADLDGDGLVAPADFFDRFRPALGKPAGPGVTEP